MVDQIFSFGELGFQEVETSQLPGRHPEEERLHGRGGRRRDSDGVHGDLGQRQAGDRAGLGHRRHSAVVAEAGRRVSRSADRGRAGPRRGPQLRPGREHHGRDRAEEDHGAREDSRHDSHLAGRGRGAGRHQGVSSSAPGSSRTWTSRCSRTSATNLVGLLGRRRRHGPRLGAVQLQGRDRARRRRAVARHAARSTPSS